MFPLLAEDPRRSSAGRPSVADLMIHEFDSWSNSEECMLNPTMLCCRLDPMPENVA
jgi:hypothetical protein